MEIHTSSFSSAKPGSKEFPSLSLNLLEVQLWMYWVKYNPGCAGGTSTKVVNPKFTAGKS
ncbi:hypothetical protein PITCH_A2210010 [uncultured Desulfobacterium sp.]|uniref:Uncharacterized protein n=1 Tax=uncultured Desulfobacterium sp. TaxID=201089 RepID=A0A445MXU4_9BACT|nr:hypothetical protein PITCH_A2210010 [uncultured Desulfobacterium sp.]